MPFLLLSSISQFWQIIVWRGLSYTKNINSGHTTLINARHSLLDTNRITTLIIFPCAYLQHRRVFDTEILAWDVKVKKSSVITYYVIIDILSDFGVASATLYIHHIIRRSLNIVAHSRVHYH